MRVSSLWASGYHNVESFACYGAPFRNMRCFKKAVSEQGDECMYTQGNQECTEPHQKPHDHTFTRTLATKHCIPCLRFHMLFGFLRSKTGLINFVLKSYVS